MFVIWSGFFTKPVDLFLEWSRLHDGMMYTSTVSKVFNEFYKRVFKKYSYKTTLWSKVSTFACCSSTGEPSIWIINRPLKLLSRQMG